MAEPTDYPTVVDKWSKAANDYQQTLTRADTAAAVNWFSSTQQNYSVQVTKMSERGFIERYRIVSYWTISSLLLSPL